MHHSRASSTTFRAAAAALPALALLLALALPARAAAAAPTVVTEAASGVGKTSATLNATVNPNGVEVTECRFEYGEATASGNTAKCSLLNPTAVTPEAVSAALSSLAPDTSYHLRIVATSAEGTSEGVEEQFTTLPEAPTVVTKAANQVGDKTRR